MNYIFRCILILSCFGVNAVMADASTFMFNPSDSATFKAKISTSDYLDLREIVFDRCDVYVFEKNYKNKTVDDRAKYTHEVLECLKDGQAAASSMATNADSRMSINAILDEKIAQFQTKTEVADSEVEFMGLNWGVGFGFSVSDDKAINEAEIVDGVVRVKSSKKEQPRVVFEFHKFLWCNKGKDGRQTIGTRGCGPFIAVAATQDDVLSGVGIGFMYGFKSTPTDTDGFSIGLGAILDADVQDLAKGFKANKAPPGTETTVRYTTKSRWSALLFVTRTF